ncbi:hypothetical protein HDU98_006554 [Podochytrium sp. JEL0797]|nr:hypothetical protein HDU98_006554 [Podochytrium sp. JEL0797]
MQPFTPDPQLAAYLALRPPPVAPIAPSLLETPMKRCTTAIAACLKKRLDINSKDIGDRREHAGDTVPVQNLLMTLVSHFEEIPMYMDVASATALSGPNGLKGTSPRQRVGVAVGLVALLRIGFERERWRLCGRARGPVARVLLEIGSGFWFEESEEGSEGEDLEEEEDDGSDAGDLEEEMEEGEEEEEG